MLGVVGATVVAMMGGNELLLLTRNNFKVQNDPIYVFWQDQRLL